MTLGRLELAGTPFKQTRSLLLLTYLALEGPKPRRYLAELLWPEASDPMNSLAVSISKLRKLGVLGADETRAWADLNCDVTELRSALLSGDTSQAAERYSGAFLEGLAGEPGPEYEEWALGVRESLAGQLQAALIEGAETEAARGQFAEAAQAAARAYHLPGAPPLDSADLHRVYTLLAAAQHPAREAVEREGHELGIEFAPSPEAARGQLRRTLLGRSRELERLLSLELGEWAWVRGGAGMGKTSVLRELASKSGWRYLPARSGLPYATLEALSDNLEGGEDAVLRRLAQAKTNFILDDWHAADPESQRLLARLRSLQPACRVVLSGEGEAPVKVGRVVDLAPLTEEALSAHPDAYAATDGVPALVGAWLRGEPLVTALESRLSGLSIQTQQVYLALAMLDAPDLSLVRQALGLEAREMSAAVNALLAAGLVQVSGRPHGKGAALEFVQARPSELALLALALARCLPDVQALPLYQQGRVLWETTDLPSIRTAYVTFARETVRRGFPARAAALLRESPPGDDVTMLLGRALERSGEYKEAMATVTGLPDSGDPSNTGELLALKSALHWRLGQPAEARQAAEMALKGSSAARAEALGTLGSLAFSDGNYVDAEAQYKRAATLWSSLGEQEYYVRALNNQASARSFLGENAETAFNEVLNAADSYPSIQAMAMNNLGLAYIRDEKLLEAEIAYGQAILVAEKFEGFSLLVNILTNLGALFHEQERFDEARSTYERGLGLARQSGEQVFVGMLLANLGELNEDLDTLREAMLLLEAGGHHAILAHVQGIYDRFILVSRGQAQH